MTRKLQSAIILFIISCSFLFYAYSSGITGVTKKSAGSGCTCHGDDPSNEVSVTIEGPDTLLINETASYKIIISGGPLLGGGTNIAVSGGTLTAGDSLQKFGSELTQVFTKYPEDTTVVFEFEYTAPGSPGEETIYANGNSVNFAQGSFGDLWNYAPDKIVTILSKPTDVKGQDLISTYKLEQNYPNPFNPSTRISYSIAEAGNVKIIVYDVSGKEVKVLLDEYREQGNNYITFSTGDLSGKSLSSGVYFYRIISNGFIETKKMVLMK